MLRQLRLINFRSFKDFSISFGDGAYLVGPNNAGKSTILTALRTADVLVRFAHRRTSSLRCVHNGRQLMGYPLILNEFPTLNESVRHEFHEDKEARFELTWQSGAKLVAVWPPKTADDQRPENFFYLDKRPGVQIRDTAGARNAFPTLGVIPILMPLEHSEGLRDDKYVRTSVSTRLSSRHFRNQLRLMREDGDFDAFRDYVGQWLDGFEFYSFENHLDASGMMLDVYYREQGSQVPKELVWAGDGVQVWLQILYHVYRTRGRETLILDEPEVYLHPDLQRKLVRMLEDTERQVIVATHSSEIVAEADPKLVMLVEKTRKRARRAEASSDLELLSNSLGTAFNLRLARALRSKVVLFVEGKDMKVIERVAKTLDMMALATERGVAVIPLEGYSRWAQVSPFAWLCRGLLPEAIKIFVLLDHDYRPEQVTREVEKAFSAEDITAHVWRRKELESYFLTPAVIARLGGIPITVTTQLLDEITSLMEDEVFGKLVGERLKIARSTGIDESTTTTAFKKEFDILWADPESRLYTCPAKDVLSDLNRRLREVGGRPFSVRNLAAGHRAYEIPTEMVAFLRKVEEAMILQSTWPGN